MSGAFERFFGAEVPESCWQAVGLDRSRTDLPGRLGAIAQALGDRLESDEELPNADRVQGHRGLPAGWEEEAVPLEPTSVLIPAIGADGAREDMLRSYFETLVVAEPVRELGGCEVMVALNDDVARANERSGFDEVVRAYDPACFGLQLATGKDALATRLLRGDLQVVEVIVGGDAPRADA